MEKPQVGLSLPEIVSHSLRTVNPAAWTYERLAKYIKDFEDQLDSDHEVGARLVTFGNTVQFHIDDIGYHGPDIITFYGVTDKGERLQLIQNIAQLSVLLIAMKKRDDKAQRIGFRILQGRSAEPEEHGGESAVETT
ncbi:MAG: DUF6173 family protein [Candidatus Sifarchaeia archaeon]